MRLSVFRILLAGALLASSTSSLAQNKLDIVEIMRQFILAEYAAKQCLRPDQQTLARFEANRRIVTIRATEEMLKRKPGATAGKWPSGMRAAPRPCWCIWMKSSAQKAVATHGFKTCSNALRYRQI